MDGEPISIAFSLNGQPTTCEFAPHMTALEVLRRVLKLTGTKQGCGIGECGACTIMVDGKAVNACLMLGAQLDRREVATVEGLARQGRPHPLQAAFVAHHGVQCGFCTPGVLMSTKALLDKNPRPDRAAVTRALAGNLCRCTGYHHIYESVAAASRPAGPDKGAS